MIVNEKGHGRVDRRYSLPADVVTAIERCARGCYQERLLGGYEAWSGAGLSGKARYWSSGYKRSRDNLLARVCQALPTGWDARTAGVLTGAGNGRRWRVKLVITRADGARLVY